MSQVTKYDRGVLGVIVSRGHIQVAEAEEDPWSETFPRLLAAGLIKKRDHRQGAPRHGFVTIEVYRPTPKGLELGRRNMFRCGA